MCRNIRLTDLVDSRPIRNSMFLSGVISGSVVVRGLGAIRQDGMQRADNKAGWRENSPTPPEFGAGPHVNEWNEGNWCV